MQNLLHMSEQGVYFYMYLKCNICEHHKMKFFHDFLLYFFPFTNKFRRDFNYVRLQKFISYLLVHIQQPERILFSEYLVDFTIYILNTDHSKKNAKA